MFHQAFLDRDFRTRRPQKLSMTSTTDLTLNRHALLLPADTVRGRHVLDLGSFIGQTGDWCLNLGAASYTGVEINPDFHDMAQEMMQHHHAGAQWRLINSAIEDFFAQDKSRFDLVFCWGVMHALVDHTWAFREMAARADHVIIQGRHPKVIWNHWPDTISDRTWHDLEYHVPYQEWHHGEQTVIRSNGSSVRVTASNTSLAVARLFMNLQGFVADLGAYEQLKILHPNEFGMLRDPDRIGYWVADFRKNAVASPVILRDVYDDRSQDAPTVHWDQI